VSQVVDFIRAGNKNLSDFHTLQGFCIGFLSAAAISSAEEWVRFEADVCNAVRLAACIGIVIDIREAALETHDRASTVSVRYKTAADRAYLETCLDAFPQVGNKQNRAG
jgi:DNA-binding transcriptional regulator YbjK